MKFIGWPGPQQFWEALASERGEASLRGMACSSFCCARGTYRFSKSPITKRSFSPNCLVRVLKGRMMQTQLVSDTLSNPLCLVDSNRQRRLQGLCRSMHRVPCLSLLRSVSGSSWEDQSSAMPHPPTSFWGFLPLVPSEETW